MHFSNKKEETTDMHFKAETQQNCVKGARNKILHILKFHS